MSKTANIHLNLTEDENTSFANWRKSIDGNNDSTNKSNMQIIDEEIGDHETRITTLESAGGGESKKYYSHYIKITGVDGDYTEIFELSFISNIGTQLSQSNYSASNVFKLIPNNVESIMANGFYTRKKTSDNTVKTPGNIERLDINNYRVYFRHLTDYSSGWTALPSSASFFSHVVDEI